MESDGGLSFFLPLASYRYIYESEKKARLQEIGPRFTLKLRSIQRGTFDSEHGDYEWIYKVPAHSHLFLLERTCPDPHFPIFLLLLSYHPHNQKENETSRRRFFL